jgi:hypothetical protein
MKHGKKVLKHIFENTKCPAAGKCPANPANDKKPEAPKKEKSHCKPKQCTPKKGCGC